MKSALDYMLRDDLSVIENEYEILWVEIKTLKVKMFFTAVLIDIQTLM